MKSGKIIIILGISASGKTYYKNYLTQKYGFYQFKRITTRVKRENENNSSDINVSKKDFEEMIKNKKFFIYTKIHGEYYGYLNYDLKKVENGINAIGDCYYKLLNDLKNIFKEKLVIICIQPYDISQTKKILESERKDYQQRLLDIDEEYNFYEKNKDKIDYIIYNDYSLHTDKKICQVIEKIFIDEGSYND